MKPYVQVVAMFILVLHALLLPLQTSAREAILNVKDFGASGSTQTTSGTIKAGSSTLWVKSAIDFVGGQGIFIEKAGDRGAPLMTTITKIDPSNNQLTLAKPAAVSVSNTYVTHDDTEAIKRALVAAHQNQTTKTVFAPKGTYLIHPAEGTNDMMKRIIMIYDRTTLRGEGYNTVFKVNPKSMYKNVMWRAIAYQGNTTMKSFRIDGSKDLVDRSVFNGDKPASLVLLRSSIDNLSNIVFDTLWLHNVPTYESEAFAVLTPNGGSNILFQNIIGWNIEGTPIHVGGDYSKNNLTHNVIVRNSTFYNNTWMGISLYGVRDILLDNIKVYKNSEHGVNLEWTHDVTLSRIEAYENGQGGVGTWGKADFTLVDSKLYNNNTTNTKAEIDLNPGSWADRSLRANAGRISIQRTTVTPRATYPHLYIRTDHNINVGNRIPDSIGLATPDAANWKIKTVISGATVEVGRFIPPIIYSGLLTIPAPIPTLAKWTKSSKISQRGSTITSTDKSGNLYTGNLLVPGKTYRATIRYQVQSDKSWWLMMKTSKASDDVPAFIELGLTGKKQGEWVETQAVFRTPTSKSARLQLQSNAEGRDSLVVDFVRLEEVVN